ncbi:Helix-turn-helix domain-containing protein [Halogranum gelatinilyticum]|uniref:Helix-turn-helix domain-containing protein n=1 Tax=Halogranum gelatinilyticum TaxID=660521 RepID=A0A1G9PHB8_9EURY|nr:helix-turn-helix domain-containing protein [Halogranum gelatinilyticum]SDL98262.1 Helix-turn-helix domain-containing protein [Halogranum gelatinilyticum]
MTLPSSTSDGDADTEGRTHTDPDAAFGALSDPVRVDIVRVLADRYREQPDDAVLSFSTLRKGVDVADSGRFLYHLKQLLGTFVAKVEGGYRLTEAGHAVVAAILAGTYTRRESVGPTELDSDCPLCDAGVSGRYADGVLRVACADGHPLFVWSLPPNAATGRSIPELVAVARLNLSHTVELLLAGACPGCWGTATTRLTGLGDESEEVSPGFRATCDTCGLRVVGPVGFCLLTQPDVVGFSHHHGVAPSERYLWELPVVQRDAATELAGDGSEEPPGATDARVRVAVTLGGETLRVDLDETARVVSTAVE